MLKTGIYNGLTCPPYQSLQRKSFFTCEICSNIFELLIFEVRKVFYGPSCTLYMRLTKAKQKPVFRMPKTKKYSTYESNWVKTVTEMAPKPLA